LIHGLRAQRLLGALCLAIATACGSGPTEPDDTGFSPPPSNPDTIPLRQLAQQRGIRIGSAVDAGFRYTGSQGTLFRAKLAREFSMLTPENDMKHASIHPARDTYRFGPADSLVTFAEANGMQVRGHTLVWHQQLASWLTNGTWTTAETRTLLDDHIRTVVDHYKGRLVAWDVVNEPFNDNGGMRSGFWFDRLGEAYIEQAFRAANVADPQAKLFLVDYNIEGINAKSDSAYALVSRLLARGVPVHGIALQGHFQVGTVPPTLAANIARFAALGLRIHIAELDVRIQLPSTTATLQQQANDYRDVFAACLTTTACEAVVAWGLTDRESWVPSTFPGWGEPMLFTGSFDPKPAFFAIYQLLK